MNRGYLQVLKLPLFRSNDLETLESFSKNQCNNKIIAEPEQHKVNQSKTKSRSEEVHTISTQSQLQSRVKSTDDSSRKDEKLKFEAKVFQFLISILCCGLFSMMSVEW
jgi:hypothetical protein